MPDRARLHLLPSSWRESPLEETLRHAKAFASRSGITRVTDITRLDRIGLPVYASIRPTAPSGSLCVNAGKGLTPLEAEVGAWMEAIEFSLAEPGASDVSIVQATARAVLDGSSRPDAVLDLCPLMYAEIDLDAPMECVSARDVFAGGDALVPAELVFFPYRPPPGGSLNFGPSTNGLCSGNSIRECLLHGLLEVIERDVRSFHWTTGRTRLVLPSSMPPEVDRVLASIASAELSIWIRYLENAFGLPCFMAVISDLDDPDPFYLSAGYGCHLSRAVAITRAVCEAAQSRLSFIHGGRDDLVERHHRFESLSDEQRRAYVRTQQEAAADATGAIRFEDTPDPGAHVPDIESALQHLRSILEGQGIQSACQVVFTRPEDTIQVSKVIVPGLEHFTASSPRVGKRLRAHVGANL